MDDFQIALEEALNSPTLTEIEKNGKLLKSIKTKYRNVFHTKYFSNGDWKEEYLYEYNNQKYIVVYMCRNFPCLIKECIKFGIVQ